MYSSLAQPFSILQIHRGIHIPMHSSSYTWAGPCGRTEYHATQANKEALGTQAQMTQPCRWKKDGNPHARHVLHYAVGCTAHSDFQLQKSTAATIS